MGKHDEAKQAMKAARDKMQALPDDASEDDHQAANSAVRDARQNLPRWHRR